MLLSGLATVILVFVVLTWFSVLLELAIWAAVLGALRLMAKADPSMRQVYLRRFRNTGSSFSDLVPYAGLIANGIILLKDRSLMAGWYCGFMFETGTHAVRDLNVLREIEV